MSETKTYITDHQRELRRERERRYRKIHAEKYRAKYRRAYWRKRDKKLASSAAWRQKNLAKVRASRLKWQKDNWAYRQEYIKQYTAKNAANLKAKKHAKYLEKKDEILKKQKRYMANLPPEVKEARRLRTNLRSSEYQKKHWGRYVAHAANRRALKYQKTFNAKLIKEWIESVKNKPTVTCYYCKTTIEGIKCHIDHVLPISRGGAHSIENLCVSCSKCNLSKNDSLLTEWFPGNQPFLAL